MTVHADFVFNPHVDHAGELAGCYLTSDIHEAVERYHATNVRRKGLHTCLTPTRTLIILLEIEAEWRDHDDPMHF